MFAGSAAKRDLVVPLRLALPALVGVVGLLAWLFLPLVTGPRTAMVFAALIPICALIAEIDRRCSLIPDPLVLAVAALALSAPFHDAPTIQVLGGALLGFMFYAVRWGFTAAGSADALGMGDVKLAAAMGAFLGPQFGLIAIVGAGVATIAVTLASRPRMSDAGTLSTFGAPFGIGLAAALATMSTARLLASP
jgi:leader peptidase (prepilin peptidase)/N-methyltransferase